MTSKSTGVPAAVLAVVLCSAFCLSAEQTALTVAVSIRTRSNEYQMQYVAGARAFIDTLPEGAATLKVLDCDANDDKQTDDIAALAAEAGKNLILFVDPNTARNIPTIAKICEDAGVYWSSVWNMPDGVTPMRYKYWVAHQACDGFAQGYDIANEMFRKFKTPGKGKLLVMQGMLANTSNTNRMEGLKQALMENPEVVVIDSQAGDWDAEKAGSIMEGWLSRHGEVDGVWCASDGMALGVVKALKAANLGKKVKVAGVDGIGEAIEAVGEGDMVCTVANNGWMQGGYGVAYAYAARAGKIDPQAMDRKHRMFYTNGFLVTAGTLPRYRGEFLEKTPSYDFDNLDFPIAKAME